MDSLIRVRKMLQPIVGRLGLRPAARFAYRRLLGLRYGKSDVASARRNGRDWRLVLEVALLDESYEPETVDWLRSVIRPGDTFLDIGANVGLISLEAALLVGPEGRVVAVEPSPGNIVALRRHIELNGMSRRIVVVEAVCAAEDGGSATLAIPGDQIGEIGSGPTLMTHQYLTGTERRLKVRRRSLDCLCRDLDLRPKAIKIDVEGAELEVIRGACETLEDSRPIVWLAFHPYVFPDPKAATNELFQMFRSAGYAIPATGPNGALAFGEHEFRHPG